MNTKKGAVIFFLFLLLVSFVAADYSSYTRYGENEAHDYYSIFADEGSSLTQIDLGIGATMAQPLVGDLDGDGNPELVLSAADQTFILKGQQVVASAVTGTMNTTGVICDIDGDGRKEIVGVFNFNGTYSLASLSYSINTLTLEASKTVNQTDPGGNVACGAIYAKDGDTANYAMFIDTTKYLWVYKPSVTTWTGLTIDVDGAVNEELTNNPLLLNHPQVVYMTSFDDDHHSVSFMAGERLYTYYGDGEEESVDSNLPGSYAPNVQFNMVQMIGDIDSSVIQDGIAVLFGGDGINAGQFGENQLVTFVSTKIPFTDNKYTIRARQKTIPIGSAPGANNRVAVSNFGVAPCSVNPTKECAIMLDRSCGNGGLGTYSIQEYNFDDNSIVGTFPMLEAVNLSLCDDSPTPHQEFYQYNRIQLLDENKDGNIDVLAAIGREVGANYTLFLTLHYGNIWNQSVVDIATIGSLNRGSSDGIQRSIITPTPVAYDADSSPDYIFSTLSETILFLTSATTAQAYPFEVEFAGSENLETTQTVTAGFNFTDSVYNYALVCNLATETIFNEQFKTGYNFTERNVSTTLSQPEDYLVFDGLQITIGGNITQFNIEKQGNAGIRDISSSIFEFTNTNNVTFDLLYFSDDFKITNYLRLNKTGTNLEIVKVVPFEAELSLANVTLSSARVNFRVDYTPKRDAFTAVEYFETEIFVNNVSSVETTTSQFDGTNIKNVQVFTDSVTTIIYRRLGFDLTPDVRPTFLQFQNGIRIVEEGVTIEIPSPSGDELNGDGFTVIPGYNEEFSSVCSYPEEGTYTQRHYVAPLNTVDYTNYKEISVAASVISIDSIEDAETEVIDDPIVDTVEEFLDSFGFASVVGRMIISLLVTGIIAYVGFTVHPILGSFGALAGLVFFSFIGYLPLWVLLILVIISAGIVALVFKKLFGEGGGG